MKINEADARIALNALSNIGPVNFQHLLNRFGSAADALAASAAALGETTGIGPKAAAQIVECDGAKTAARERATAVKEGVTIVTLMDDGYPANLKMAHTPPPVLYIAGEIRREDALAIAVIGSRGPTPYGRIAAENFTAMLSRRGFVIISGMARGIDTMAHRATLAAGGRTIAVLGSGLDRCYPPENAELFKQIAKSGAVISQFPFGAEPEQWNFPMRNRVISGLSLGVLVIEAGEKSGTMSTAYGALDEGREVFAVPGRIDSSKSIGCNRLIQKGAKLVISPDDVVNEFPPEVQAALAAPGAGEARAPLSPDAGRLAALLENGERHVDFLVEGSGMPSGVVLGVLLEMELRGTVRQLPGKLFALLQK